MITNKAEEKLNIICLSNQLWDFENWTNKKHVMYRLSKMGHNVLFVDPPFNTGFLFLRQLRRGLWNLSRLARQFKYDPSRVIVYTPLNLVPFGWFTSLLHALRIRLLSRLLDSKRNTVLWVYHVEIAGLKHYMNLVKHDVLVYDCVDNYVGFPRHDTLRKKEKIRKIEEYLTRKADVVFATTESLTKKLSKYNMNTHFTPNVGDFDRFKNTRKYKYKIPEDLKKIPPPRIGFIGAIDPYKFDINLVKRVAQDHPNYSFVIIGPSGLKDDDVELGLEKLNNVYYLGSKPYKDKKHYMAGFSVDIIPYVLNDYTINGCFPVKFHDSLAAGMPLVVTDLPSYAPFEDVCYISKSYEEFSKNIKRALDEDSLGKIKERQRVAKKHSWDNKVEKMVGLINDALTK